MIEISEVQRLIAKFINDEGIKRYTSFKKMCDIRENLTNNRSHLRIPVRKTFEPIPKTQSLFIDQFEF